MNHTQSNVETSAPQPTPNRPRYRVREATEGGRRIGWMVVDHHNPDAAPLSQHWNHTDAVLAAERAERQAVIS